MFFTVRKERDRYCDEELVRADELLRSLSRRQPLPETEEAFQARVSQAAGQAFLIFEEIKRLTPGRTELHCSLLAMEWAARAWIGLFSRDHKREVKEGYGDA